MFVSVLWYFTAIFAVWSASLGGISVPMIGLLYPFRIAAAVLFIFLIFQSRKPDWNVGKKTWFTVLPVLAYMILHSILSLVWAQDQIRTVKVILNFLFVAVFLILFLRIVRDRKSFHSLLYALSLNFIAILAVGIFESFSSNYLFCDPAGVDVSWRINAYGLSYPVVCFTNPNDFAFAITLTVPLMLYVLDEALALKKWQRIAGKMLLIALSFFNIMQTCSRLGYLVYFVVMVIYLAMQIKKSVLETIFFGLLMAVLVLSMAGIIKIDFRVKAPGKAAGASAEAITVVSAADTSTHIRLTLLKKGLRVTRDSYGLGAGAKNSPTFMARYTDISKKDDYGVTDYHFFYMELMADYGVPLLVLFLCFQAGTFFAAIHILRKRPEHRWLALCCMPGVVGFALASGNCSSAMFVYVMWIQFAIWSFMTSVIGAEFLERRKTLKLKK